MDVRWSENLSVGNATLDGHHKRLFELTAELGRSAAAGGEVDAVMSVLWQLSDYIEYHFREEEAMMAASNFPFLELHRLSHQSIAIKVNDIAERLAPDNLLEVTGELQRFLEEWLIHHIEIEDFEYVPYLTGAGSHG